MATGGATSGAVARAGHGPILAAMRTIRRLLLLIAFSAMLVLCFLDLESPGDYTGFVAFGQAANDGALAYDPAVQARYMEGGHHWATWPPGFVPLASGLAVLDGIAHAPAVITFQLLNLAMLALVLLVIVEWLTGRRVALPGAAAGPEDGIAWDASVIAVALLVPIRLVVNNFEHAQVNLVVLGLVVLGFRLLERRPLAGGLLFGLGSAIKATPILLLPYLAWRARGRAFGAAALGALVGWVALPALVLGPEGAVTWWRAWIEALPLAGAQEGWMNQSLRSMAVLHLGADAGFTAWLVGTVALAGAILLAFGRPFRAVEPRRTAAEVAVLLVAITIVSPVAWKAHYVTLVPLCAAIFVFVREVGGAPRRLAFGSLVVAFAGISLTPSDLIGRTPSVVFQRYGIVLMMALLLVVAALVLLRTAADSASSDSAPADSTL